MQALIRTYPALDRNAVISIFHSNCPRYFDPKDLEDLQYYVDHFADENLKVFVLEVIQNEPYDFDIVINTTQLVARTFYTFGFETE